MISRQMVACPLLAVLLLYGACSMPREGLLRLYQHNSGEIVNLDVGETMEVLLDGDPTTTVNWIKVPNDPDILAQVGGLDYVTDLTTPDGRERLRLRFRATAPGRTRLQLTYQHPRQRPTAEDVDFEIWVVVEEEDE